jgi:DNA repair exonuclease SbcCD ATPase subunit
MARYSSETDEGGHAMSAVEDLDTALAQARSRTEELESEVKKLEDRVEELEGELSELDAEVKELRGSRCFSRAGLVQRGWAFAVERSPEWGKEAGLCAVPRGPCSSVPRYRRGQKTH